MKKFFSKVYKHWMMFARVLGRIQTVILLFLIYFLICGPARLILLVLRKDRLDKKRLAKSSFWRIAELDKSYERSLRQF